MDSAMKLGVMLCV